MRLDELSARKRALDAFIKYHEEHGVDDVYIIHADVGETRDRTNTGGKFDKFSPDEFICYPTPEGWVCTLSHRHVPNESPHGAKTYRFELRDDSSVIRESCD